MVHVVPGLDSIIYMYGYLYIRGFLGRPCSLISFVNLKIKYTLTIYSYFYALTIVTAIGKYSLFDSSFISYCFFQSVFRNGTAALCRDGFCDPKTFIGQILYFTSFIYNCLLSWRLVKLRLSEHFQINNLFLMFYKNMLLVENTSISRHCVK